MFENNLYERKEFEIAGQGGVSGTSSLNITGGSAGFFVEIKKIAGREADDEVLADVELCFDGLIYVRDYLNYLISTEEKHFQPSKD